MLMSSMSKFDFLTIFIDKSNNELTEEELRNRARINEEISEEGS